jgi:hypothetical protein
LTLLLLWIVLEALFRGGWKGFWTYLGTGLARVLLLFGTLGIFAQLSTQTPAAERWLLELPPSPRCGF